MGSIYNDEGQLDYEKAAAELRAASSLANDVRRQAAQDGVSAASLLDIAASLNMLVSGFAMGGIVTEKEVDDADADDERELGEAEGDDVQSFRIGDTVVFKDDETGELVGRIDELTESEGAAVAVVEWADGTVGKAWLAALERWTPPAEPEPTRSEHFHFIWIDGGNDLQSEPCRCSIGSDHTDANPWDNEPDEPETLSEAIDLRLGKRKKKGKGK